jgi:hypothetical protein
MGTQMAQGASSIISGIGQLVSARLKYMEAALKTESAYESYAAQVLNTMVQTLEKIYSSSQDSSSKVWQMLQDVIRQLEALQATVNKFGGWDR